jgi:hypothetical protein
MKFYYTKSTECDPCRRMDDLKARVSKTRATGGRSVAEEEDDD